MDPDNKNANIAVEALCCSIDYRFFFFFLFRRVLNREDVNMILKVFFDTS